MTDPLASNPSLRLRAPRMTDAAAVTALVNLADDHDFGVADLEVEDVRDEWRTLDLEHDAWLLVDRDEVVAAADVSLRAEVEYRVNLYVHPGWRRRGLGSLLFARVLARANQRIADDPATHGSSSRASRKAAGSPACHSRRTTASRSRGAISGCGST